MGKAKDFIRRTLGRGSSPNIWGINQLAPHPETPPRDVERVTAQILWVDPVSASIEWAVTPTRSLLLPPLAEWRRADNLWRTTCFEAFLKSADSDAYVELNFSPSLEWAAYAFDGYRTGRLPLAFQRDPDIEISDFNPLSDADPMREPDPTPPPPYFFLSAEFDPLPFLSRPIKLGLSAVIEEIDGTKSYWALAHPPGPPDFHHPDCFVLELPAPRAP